MATRRVDNSVRVFLEDLGVDFEGHRDGQALDPRNRAFNLRSGIFFDDRLFRKNKTLVGDFLPLNRQAGVSEYELTKHIDTIPISSQGQQELRQFLTNSTDLLPGLSSIEKITKLKSISYSDFLTKYVGLSQEAINVLFMYPTAITGLDCDTCPAYLALQYLGMPGWNLLGELGKKCNTDIEQSSHIDLSLFFPDGNASIARLLVKHLIPAVNNGDNSCEDIIGQQFNYARLDVQGSPVRLRLNSTAVKVVNENKGVSVTYVRGGRAYRVRAKHSVLACFNMMIPHLCPQLPEEQKEALSSNVKVPLLSTNVLLRSARPLADLGAASFYCPGRLHSEILAVGRSFGVHEQDFDQDKPVVLNLIGSVLESKRGLSAKEQYRRGRHKLLTMSFEEIEHEVREHLAGMLGPTGFNVQEDILGITVNRWPHGYSYSYSTLSDPHYEEGKKPHEIARQRFGQITIANSDAGAVPGVEEAIKQGLRSVGELF